MHYITALVGKLPIDEAEAVKYDLPIFKENGFAIVALNVNHSDYWTEKLNCPRVGSTQIILDCGVTHLFARALFGDRPFAIISTDYFGGYGDQSAAVYEGNAVVFQKTSTTPGAINEALKRIGVKRGWFSDEFTALNLAKYRCFDKFFKKYESPK